MQSIVETLTALKGVRQVGIYNNGEVISTNFSDDVRSAMLNSSEVVAQIFLALEAVEKTHNEIFFEIKSGYLAGFRLFGGYTALLLTDKKINLPLISMGIKSASEKLKQQLEESQLSLARESQLTDSATNLAAVDPTHEALLPVINEYTYILTAFLGPAAGVVVNDAVEQWKDTYVESSKNLTYLIALLESELETDKERQLFRSNVAKVAAPDM